MRSGGGAGLVPGAESGGIIGISQCLVPSGPAVLVFRIIIAMWPVGASWQLHCTVFDNKCTASQLTHSVCV